MTLFKRSVVSEIMSHAGVVMSTLLIIWLSVLLVRLVGDAASGSIGAEVVLGIALLSMVTALPVILAASMFIAVLTTVTRSYKESEMVVWQASGVALRSWFNPVARCAIPVALIIALFTYYAAPWAQRQMSEYKQRFELRSDLSKVSAGQFVETENGARVFFTEESLVDEQELGEVLVRIIEPQWFSIVTAESAHVETESNGDRFLVLNDGHRYDLHNDGSAQFRITDFEHYGVRLETRDDRASDENIRLQAEQQIKARPTALLIGSDDLRTQAQLMWRSAMPLAAIVLAFLAVPLGAVNPRLGRSGNILIASLLALLYMNLINLSRSWVSGGSMGFWVGIVLVHALFVALTLILLWQKTRISAPRAPSLLQ